MNSFILLLTSHFLADFTFQPYKLSEKKKNSIRFLLLHALIYSLLTFLVCLLFGSTFQIVFFGIIISVSHILLDFIKIKLDKKFNNVTYTFYSFLIDQLMHISILFVISLFLKDFNFIGNFLITKPYNFLGLEFVWNINLNKIFRIILAIVIVGLPSSVFIKHFFNFVFRTNHTQETNIAENVCKEDENNKAGSIIGVLERLLVLVLGLMGLYTSIALVLTAKSIARFKLLEDKSFAEKYLVGTLLSMLIAVLCILFCLDF
ncbi:MAG TPA: DUF3307 domain-containing protein [Clostridia bacterium]